jgi:periplasmic protein TonB
MKKLSLVLLLCFTLKARSQEKESFYVFDSAWNPTKIETARFFLHTYPLNDTCWQWDYYNFTGPLIRTEQYRDKEGNEMNGVSYHYNKRGYIDSSAHFSNGKRNGESYKLSGDSLNHRIKYVYLNDTLIEKVNLDTVKKDPVVSVKDDEKESEYPGGLKAWSKYLLGNLKYPDRAMNGNFQGQVVVRFIIDKEGFVIEPVISGSVEYSIDAEAIRIIKKSGKWQPAFQNGHVVKSYKQQPINFRLR